MRWGPDLDQEKYSAAGLALYRFAMKISATEMYESLRRKLPQPHPGTEAIRDPYLSAHL
jgi:hypothetical protein